MNSAGTLVKSKSPRSQKVLLGGFLESYEHSNDTGWEGQDRQKNFPEGWWLWDEGAECRGEVAVLGTVCGRLAK